MWGGRPRGVAQKGPTISSRIPGPRDSRGHTTTAQLPDPVIVAQRLIAALGVLVLTAAMVLLGAPWSQAAPVARNAATTVRITDTLSPQHLSVRPGRTVTWVNRDDRAHAVMAMDGADSFDSGNLRPGQRWSHTFRSPGSVSYHDALHAADPAYFGKVMVQRKVAGAGATDTARTVRAAAPASMAGMSMAGMSMTPAVAKESSGSDGSGSGSSGHGSGGSGGSASNAPMKVFVEIHNKNEFRPGTVTIQAGGTVTWFNDDSHTHTTSGAGGINSGDLDRDDTYSHTFDKPGTYDYVCAYHSEMQGTVRVADKSGHVPPPADNGGNPPPPPSNGGQNATVSIGSNFGPHQVSVPVGGTVTWTNNSSMPHTATGSGFDSGNLNPGQSFSHTFNAAGTYDYVCSYHSNMTGTVTVTDGSGGTPPPPPGGGNPPPPPGGGNPPPPGGGGGTPPPPPPGGGGSTAPAKASVSLQNMAFSPTTVKVKKGGVVTWTNRDSMPHTVTAKSGAFDSGNMNPGATFKKRFTKPGRYSYFCAYHPDMVATVLVPSASGKTPPPPPSKPGKPSKPGNPGGPNGGTQPGGGAAPSSPSAKTFTVNVTDQGFSPSTLNARVGDTVVWTNTGQMPHTVTAGNGAFDSGNLDPGAKYTTVLRKQGTISYVCSYHSFMKGTLKVGAAPAGTKLPPPSAGGVSGGSSASSGSTSSTASSSGSSSAPASPDAKEYTVNIVNGQFDPDPDRKSVV